jgi:hypothetical protein
MSSCLQGDGFACHLLILRAYQHLMLFLGLSLCYSRKRGIDGKEYDDSPRLSEGGYFPAVLLITRSSVVCCNMHGYAIASRDRLTRCEHYSTTKQHLETMTLSGPPLRSL